MPAEGVVLEPQSISTLFYRGVRHGGLLATLWEVRYGSVGTPFSTGCRWGFRLDDPADLLNCTVCGPLPRTRFHADRKSPRGFRSKCKGCQNKLRRAHRNRAGSTARAPGLRTIVVFSDVHYETRHRGLWSAAMEWLRDNRKLVDTLVFAGDYLELQSMSAHGGNAEVDKLSEDLEQGRIGLKEAQEAAGPDTEVVLMEGNHESRLGRYIVSRAANLAGSLDVPGGLKLAEMGIRWVPESRQPVDSTWGNLRLIHGHQIDSGGRGAGLYQAQKLLPYGGVGVTVACGHYHRFQMLTRPVFGGIVNLVSMYCMRSLYPTWRNGAEDGWGLGFVHRLFLFGV